MYYKTTVAAAATTTVCSKEGRHQTVSVTLSYLDQFSKFSHWQTHLRICSKVIINDSTTPVTRCHTTL